MSRSGAETCPSVSLLVAFRIAIRRLLVPFGEAVCNEKCTLRLTTPTLSSFPAILGPSRLMRAFNGKRIHKAGSSSSLSGRGSHSTRGGGWPFKRSGEQSRKWRRKERRGMTSVTFNPIWWHPSPISFIAASSARSGYWIFPVFFFFFWTTCPVCRSPNPTSQSNHIGSKRIGLVWQKKTPEMSRAS